MNHKSKWMHLPQVLRWKNRNHHQVNPNHVPNLQQTAKHVAPNIWLCCKSCWQLNSMSSQYLESVFGPPPWVFFVGVWGNSADYSKNSYEKLYGPKKFSKRSWCCLVHGETPCWPNNFRKGHWNILCVDWASICWLQAFICITGLFGQIRHGTPSPSKKA